MDLVFTAFAGNSPLMNAMHPHNDTPTGIEKARQKYIKLLEIDYSQRWIQVTKEDGELVGVAQWNVYDGAMPPDTKFDGPPGTWDTEDDKEWAQCLLSSLMKYRRPVLLEATGPVICLLKMTVAERYRRRGIGSLMMKWGMDLADEIDALCTVESTPEGQNLYKKFDFTVQHDVVLDVPEKFASRPKQRLLMMLRQKKSLRV